MLELTKHWHWPCVFIYTIQYTILNIHTHKAYYYSETTVIGKLQRTKLNHFIKNKTLKYW